MKQIIIVLAVVLLSAFVKSDAASLQDPLVVNAKTMTLKLDNNRVRAMEANLKPGDKEEVHSHPPYVIYVIEGGKIRSHATDGTTTDAEFKKGEVLYRGPLTHWAENIGDTTIKLIVVELKN